MPKYFHSGTSPRWSMLTWHIPFPAEIVQWHFTLNRHSFFFFFFKKRLYSFWKAVWNYKILDSIWYEEWHVASSLSSCPKPEESTPIIINHYSCTYNDILFHLENRPFLSRWKISHAIFFFYLSCFILSFLSCQKLW